MNRLKVKDAPNLARDVDSNGIINTDDVQYNEYRKKKFLAQRQLEEKENEKHRLAQLEKDVIELKSGISQILELLTHNKTS